MKLRTLHIKGFKSFGNETTIHFNDEITGIVGPNGSGKSNIVDAIRWVLGEQKSRELRLEKMVDVIFNGTKSKRKAGMAMVSMTFENSKKLIPVEFDTVKISRILYDTNESEYRINEVPCRLKDVRDLFLDTGIGSNSYAIIELGMVDDILVDKDHSRRRMFEQAAGISKYKIRKREAQLKLNNTQSDLDRVQDIIFELEAGMRSLEKQARRTKRYYELREDYRDLSIKKAFYSQTEALEKEREYKLLFAEEKDRHVQLSTTLHTLEAEIESIKKANLESEQKLNQKQREYNELIDRLKSTENKKEILRQNIGFKRQNIEREKNNMRLAGENLEKIESQLKEKQSQLDSLDMNSTQLQTAFEEKKALFEAVERDRKNIQGASSIQLAELKSLEDRKLSIERGIIEKESHSAHLMQNSKQAAEEIESNNEKLRLFEKERKILENEVAESNNRLNGLKEKKQEQESGKARLSEKMERLNSDLAQKVRKLDALNNEYNLLKDMVDKLEGFPESAKFLVDKWEKPRPLLSDIIECPDEYRTAIEAYLDNFLAYFILEDVEEARKSIDILKQAQKGKARFFILSSFEEKVSNVRLLYDHHGLPALEVVRSDARYRALLYYLLHNVVLVEDEEVFNSGTLDEEIVYLSKEGATSRAKHIVGGGSVGLFDGKRIGRRKDIDKIAAAIKEIKKEINKTEEKLQELRGELNSLFTTDYESLIQQEERQRSGKEVELAQKETRMESLMTSVRSLEERILLFEKEVNNNKEEKQKLEEQVLQLQKQINEQKAGIDEKAGKAEDITSRYSRLNADFNKAQLDWIQHQSELKALKNELEFRTQQKQELQAKVKSSTEELGKIQELLAEEEEKLKELETDLLKIYDERKEKQSELSVSEELYFSKRTVVSKKEEALKNNNKAIQESQMKLNTIKDNLTGIEFELRSAMERLKIEFNIDLDSLDREALNIEEVDADEMEANYEKLKKRLDNYGEINPLAVEAFDEIQQRHDSMASQRDDIVEARISLEETISEIDKDATEKFLASFEKVKANFKVVFRSLFSGEDDCDLVLFNPENPLESDIEIVAKPKGKRPKVLNQLSGGEKTLTATALLFSLYLLKPAPFCIFDEVDAPLDDVNIRKFSKLIRQFSDESQFIIITHNKSTMASVDVLYGVYMQEQGISGITQVDFRDYEHEEVFQDVKLS